jgi:hypothetical protein
LEKTIKNEFYGHQKTISQKNNNGNLSTIHSFDNIIFQKHAAAAAAAAAAAIII